MNIFTLMLKGDCKAAGFIHSAVRPSVKLKWLLNLMLTKEWVP